MDGPHSILWDRLSSRLVLWDRLSSRSSVGAVAALLWLTLLVSGCAAPGGQQSDAGRSARSEVLGSLVDPSEKSSQKARLSLAEIEPAPPHPHKLSDPIKPPSSRAMVRIARAKTLAAQQRFTEAGLELESALRYDPEHPVILTALALLRWSADNPQRAGDSARRALAKDEDIAAAHYVMGRVAALDHARREATNHYRTALLCSDFSTDLQLATLCHYHLARSLAQEGYWTAALEQYEVAQRAIALPELKNAHLDNGELATLLRTGERVIAQAKSTLLEQLGDYVGAASQLAPLMDTAQADVSLRLRYADLLLKAGQTDRAMAAARAIEGSGTKLIDLLARIHTERGRPQAIIAEIRARMSAVPGDSTLVLRLADAHLRFAQPDQCRRVLESFIAAHPDALAVRLRLINVLMKEKLWSDAIRTAGLTIEHDRDTAQAVTELIEPLGEDEEVLSALLQTGADQVGVAQAYLIGQLALSAERFGPAEVWLTRCVERWPAFVPARALLGLVLVKTYRFDDAVRVAARAEESSAQDARLEVVLARAYEGLDDFKKAEQHYQAAIQMNPADSSAMFTLAQLYHRTGRHLQQERHLLSLLKDDPAHEQAREALLVRYLRTGRVAEAEGQLLLIPRRFTRGGAIARCEAQLGLLKTRDVEAYRRRLQLPDDTIAGKQDAATMGLLGESFLQTREFDKAREQFELALSLDPANADIAMRLVRVDYVALEFERASRRLSALWPRYPNRHSWRLAQIDLLSVIQDFEKAMALARGQLARDDLTPEQRRVYRQVLVGLLDLAREDQAKVALLRVWADAQTSPGQWSARLIDALIDTDQAEAALPVAEAMLEALPDSPQARGRYVKVLVAIGGVDRASQYLLDQLDEDPESTATVQSLARALEKSGRAEEALELVRNQLADPLLRDHYIDDMVFLLNRTKRYDECIRLLEDLARARKPAEAGVLQRVIVRVMLVAKRYRDAGNRLTQLIDDSRSPRDSFEYLQLLATSYEAQGMGTQASQTLERALAIRPTDVTVNNNLGYMWADRGEQLDRAEKMIRLAVSGSPREASYLDSLGWVMYKKGDFVGARKWIGRAVRARREEDPVVLDHFGDAYWRSGMADEAIRQWQFAVDAARDRLQEDDSSVEDRKTLDSALSKIAAAQADQEPAVAPIGES